MRVVVQNVLTHESSIAHEGTNDFAIGARASAEVCLSGGRRVWPELARVRKVGGAWTLTVTPGTDPIVLNGEKVLAGESRGLPPLCELQLPEFSIKLDSTGDAQPDSDSVLSLLHTLQHDLHALVLRSLDAGRFAVGKGGPSAEQLDLVNVAIDTALRDDLRERVFCDERTKTQLLAQAIQLRLEALVHSRSRATAATHFAGVITIPGRNEAAERQLRACIDQIRGAVPEIAPEQAPPAGIDEALRVAAKRMALLVGRPVLEYAVAQYLKKITCDLLFGLGPLQDLLNAPGISEVMIVQPDLVYIERGGKLIRSNRTFVSADTLMAIIERVLAPAGRTINKSQPAVDARIGGARVHAIIPPLALRGPCLTIRRFMPGLGDLDALCSPGCQFITSAGGALLRAAVLGRKNILVAGATGAGKTTLLNALGRSVPADERIITIEDSAELHLEHPHVVTLEARRANAEDKGEVTVRDLVRHALRMRPDRIIIGECRGPEAFDMLQAMNTGHAGCLTTLHANSSSEAISRLEGFVSGVVSWPVGVVRRHIAQSIDLIVYVNRTRAGRRVTQVSELVGVDPVTDSVEVIDILAADDGVTLRPTGHTPAFLPGLVEQGHLSVDQWLSGGER